MIPINPPSGSGVSHVVPLPKRYALPIVRRYALARVHLATTRCDRANNPLKIWAQRRRRFRNRFANVDFPEVVQFNGNVDADTRQTYKIIGRNDPEPSARDDQSPASIDVEYASDTRPGWHRRRSLSVDGAACRLRGDGGRDGRRGFLAGLPGPGHHLADAVGGGQLGEDVGEPGARIDVIELAGLDQGIDGCGAAAPRVRAGEGPIASASAPQRKARSAAVSRRSRLSR